MRGDAPYLVALLLAVGCAAAPRPDLSAPMLLAANGGDSVVAESLATVPPKELWAIQVSFPTGASPSPLGDAVRIEFVVRPDGVPDPASVKVVTSARDPRLTQATINGILATRFQPGLLDGRRVAVRMRHSAVFRRSVIE